MVPPSAFESQSIMSATVAVPVNAVAESAPAFPAPGDLSKNTSDAAATDVDYDGDSESVVPRTASSENLHNPHQRTPVKKRTSGIGRHPTEASGRVEVEDMTEATSASQILAQRDDLLSDNTPRDVKAQVSSPVSSRTASITSTSSASSPASMSSRQSSSSSSSSSPSRKFFSAAVQVSTLQASFAEKTAAEMQEIIGWYSDYKKEERFTKVDQRQSLPDNAMVVDEEESDNESECDDEAEALDQESSIHSASDILSPTPSKKRRSPCSTKVHRADQVREHLEASDHLIRITQYMAEIITELEHSSSSSGNDEDDESEDIAAMKESSTNETHEDDCMNAEALQRLAQETAILREECERRIKSQERQPAVRSNHDVTFAVMMTWILPILAAIFLGLLLTSSWQTVESR